MTMADTTDETPPPSAIALALRQKIGWLCQIIRGLGLVWAAWIFLEVVAFWGDRDKALGAYARLFKFDARDVALSHYYVAFGLQLAACALAAWVAWALWRLFSHYLDGDIFSVAAALGLRRLALVGAAALLFDLVQRPIIFALITAGHEASPVNGWFFHPSDLLDAIFVTFLFSLAYIFKTAAELADEHAQIV
jgi:hypothetical protein